MFYGDRDLVLQLSVAPNDVRYAEILADLHANGRYSWSKVCVRYLVPENTDSYGSCCPTASQAPAYT